ncbi:uncharacterized protein KD926_007172 [Aspergillus affinis]|uniref:uncharacterized protein n=1 Tax=Aspergillus affinis TaxID=1070780 RepID=UPI0022FDB64C|nr:uncharacterized protein KD926_007172 [Aspergillus affinis]KAI9041218.1 hypothetical protein KD926_007172 [Aspergillus affinis]
MKQIYDQNNSDIEQKLAGVKEVIRDHDILIEDHKRRMAMDCRHSLKRLEATGQPTPIVRQQPDFLEADIVKDARRISKRNDFESLVMFEMIYACPIYVAERLQTDRVTYVIQTLNTIANYTLNPEYQGRKISLSQEEAAENLKSFLLQIHPDSRIPVEKIANLHSICDAFRAAKEERTWSFSAFFCSPDYHA